MGTSGAVKRLAHLLDSTFLVLNGDVLVDIDFQRLVGTASAGRRPPWPWSGPRPERLRPGPGGHDNRVTAFLEKPGDLEDSWVTDLINAGVTCSSRRCSTTCRLASRRRSSATCSVAAGLGRARVRLRAARLLARPGHPDRLPGRPVRPARGAPAPAHHRHRAGPQPVVRRRHRVDEAAVLRGPILVGQGAVVEGEGRCSARPCSAPTPSSPAGPAWSARCCWRGRGSSAGRCRTRSSAAAWSWATARWSATAPWSATTSRSSRQHPRRRRPGRPQRPPGAGRDPLLGGPRLGAVDLVAPGPCSRSTNAWTTSMFTRWRSRGCEAVRVTPFCSRPDQGARTSLDPSRASTNWRSWSTWSAGMPL